jgi:wingless-type MMTV integration site family protein 4
MHVGDKRVAGSREKAYIYAVSSAGVTYAVTKACARGEMNICGCDTTVRARETRGTFTWGGCSHNVAFGERFAGEFLDEHENDIAADGLMNLWNNKAGRRVRLHLLFMCYSFGGTVKLVTYCVYFSKPMAYRNVYAVNLFKPKKL